jgi:amidase
MTDPADDAVTTAARIRSGEVSAQEVVEAAIIRIVERNPGLNAVVHRRFEAARAEVERGLPPGPLSGVPMLVKDLGIEVEGLPITRGSRLFAEAIARNDSELAARYRRAGLVVLGSTNSPELGLNGSTEPLLYGPTRNPRAATHSVGGSSGGSAAVVAAGMVPVAHANDGGGSIRIPAAANGLFGLKPSRGRTPGWPSPGALAAPLSVTHAVTTTVRDSAALLDAVAGQVAGDAIVPTPPIRPYSDEVGADPGRLRIGWTTTSGDGTVAHEDCVRAVERALVLLRDLGHEVAEVSLDHDGAAVTSANAVLMQTSLIAAVDQRLGELGRPLRDDDLEPFTKVLYDYGRSLTAQDLDRALRAAQEVGWRSGRLLDAYDLVLSPTLGAPVPEIGVLDTTDVAAMYTKAAVYATFTSVYNLTGQPAMSVPTGTDSNGLPMGVQYAAAYGREDLLLRLASQIEQAAPWPRTAAEDLGARSVAS